MKNIIFALAVASVIVVGSIFTCFPSPAQKAIAAQNKLQEARISLSLAKSNASEEAEKETFAEQLNSEIWKSEDTIMKNENRIVEINSKITKSGTALDEHYGNRIDALQMKNYKLKKRIETIKNNQSLWVRFSGEFRQDLKEFAQTVNVLVFEKRN